MVAHPDRRAPTLAELEGWLVAVSTHAAGVSAGIHAAASQYPLGQTADLAEIVTPGRALSALERLAIYNDGYFARLTECLGDDYPALQHALGASEFERTARAYIAAHPSRSPSLNAYGASFATFLGTLASPWAPFAVDLARLEWALVEVIHAATAPKLEPDALARLRPEDWSRARLVPTPALRVLAFAHPVNPFYQAFRQEAQPKIPASTPSAVAIHRSPTSLTRHDLDPPMFAVLAPLVAGVPLARAMEELAARLTPSELVSAQARLPDWFAGWTGSGFFTAIELT